MSYLEKAETVAEIRAAVEDFFERKDAKYIPFNERNVARARYGVNSKIKGVEMLFIVSPARLVVKSMLPLQADPEGRTKVAEFLLRANYGMRTGGFDFDFEDGEISYRVSHYCGDEGFAPPTFDQIEFAVITNLLMVSKYGDALAKVVFGMAEPEDAIAEAEGDN